VLLSSAREVRPIFIETIKYPTDATEAWWDVFDVVEELPNPKFDIPFDSEAKVAGNRDDLFEHNAEMWGDHISKVQGIAGR
jgi:hypothetical protein